MKLHKLYRKGYVGSKALEVPEMKLSKLLKKMREFEDKMCMGRPPEADGIFLKMYADNSASITVLTWPPSTSEEVLLLSIEEVRVE